MNTWSKLYISTCRNVDDTIIAGPGFDQEELGKWHRTEQEKEEAREQMQRTTCSRPTVLGKGVRKRWAVSKILEEMVELRPTDDSKEYQPPAKRTHRKLRDGDSNS
ncbi:hypothetical protein EDD85DRAFT_798403 [Armillaria nabsnona]|nr:hypothetical protein EDD85DRAFT_798403 [Armillaria nabsnona]